mmetsp:Transcript_27801/g.60816  ORF Transcript_27801/g.60816 Transcript_27801/m.60816 type:complete len:426 (+) Transcript_27801:1499-2776(+)
MFGRRQTLAGHGIAFDREVGHLHAGKQRRHPGARHHSILGVPGALLDLALKARRLQIHLFLDRLAHLDAHRKPEAAHVLGDVHRVAEQAVPVRVVAHHPGQCGPEVQPLADGEVGEADDGRLLARERQELHKLHHVLRQLEHAGGVPRAHSGAPVAAGHSQVPEGEGFRLAAVCVRHELVELGNHGVEHRDERPPGHQRHQRAPSHHLGVQRDGVLEVLHDERFSVPQLILDLFGKAQLALARHRHVRSDAGDEELHHKLVAVHVVVGTRLHRPDHVRDIRIEAEEDDRSRAPGVEVGEEGAELEGGVLVMKVHVEQDQPPPVRLRHRYHELLRLVHLDHAKHPRQALHLVLQFWVGHREKQHGFGCVRLGMLHLQLSPLVVHHREQRLAPGIRHHAHRFTPLCHASENVGLGCETRCRTINRIL